MKLVGRKNNLVEVKFCTKVLKKRRLIVQTDDLNLGDRSIGEFTKHLFGRRALRR